MFRYFVLFIICLSPLSIYSQCDVKNSSFRENEEIVYKAVYNWGIIWVEAGEVVFKTQNDKFENKDVYHISGVGKSLPRYDWFFTVRDYYDAYISKKDLRPYKYVRNTYERGYKVDNTYLFDYDKKKITTRSKNSNKKLHKDTLNLEPCTFDLMSAIYYVRNIDYEKCKIGEKIPMKLIVDNELIELYIRYLGKEVIKIGDDKKYRCLKFSALLMEGTIFKGGEDVTVWVTDDKNKVPVLINAEILVGTVKAVLSSTKGLKHKTDCIVQ